MSFPITMTKRVSSSSKDEDLHRGAWTAMEDQLLSEYVKINGETGWNSIPRKIGLKRCGKSCRLRWLNYLRPGIKRGNISSEEEELIIRLHGLLGNRWALIAGRLPGRTDNEIKNYWNTHLCKKRPSSERSLEESNKRRKSCPPATDGLLKVTPVKATAVRIRKGCNKSVHSDSGDSNHASTDRPQTVKASMSYSGLLVQESITNRDSSYSDIIDITVAAELESPSVEMNGQYSPEDFRIEELEESPCVSFEISFLSRYIEQIENCTDGGYNGMEGQYSGTHYGDWMDQLPYFHTSSLMPSEFQEEDFTQFS
ncbi:hypothetical protein SUGI_1003080 [Cryptomeria japonica]|nr:hypothetical protein SUGI_1003080 [Cryptomeria japonica]